MDIAKARPFDSSTTHRSHPPRDGTQGAGSATILIAWELGGGLGHLIPMTPVVERLLGYGHRVVLVLRDLTRAARVFNGLEVTLLQAPIRTTRSDNHIETPRSFAHILHNNGYADRDELRGLAEGWRNLYDTIRPDLVLCDHSPTALLAASGSGLRTATIGTGFCCPPDTEPLPDFRPWLPNATRQLLDDEHHVLANLNHVLASWNRPNLDRLSLLYRQVDECFLATFEELDHYPLRQNGWYWGTWPHQGGKDSIWPAGPGKRVFAYLKPFPALPGLLAFLSDIKLPTLIYGDRIATALRDRYRSDSLRFADRLLDLNEVGRQCDLAILNAGHGSTSGMLLCGKPILQVPLNLEQTLTAHATVRLGAGLSGDRNNPLDIVSKLTSMIQCEGYAKAACDFATRYEGFNGAQQLDVLASRLHRLVNQPSEPEAEIAAASVSHRVVGIASQHSARTLVVGIGTGRCGTKSLAMLLNQQPSTVITHEMRPLLPWNSSLACHDIRARFESLFNRHPQVARVGDVGHFYLPYLDQILENFSDVRVICLQRNRQDTVNSFLCWIVSTRNGRPVNHWAADRDGFDTDLWDDCFPKYPTRDMGAAIGHYWDEYYQTAGTWARYYPDKIRIFPMEPVLNDAAKIRELLAWIGVSAEQSDPVSIHIHRSHTIDIDNQWPDIQAIAKAGLGQRIKRIK